MLAQSATTNQFQWQPEMGMWDFANAPVPPHAPKLNIEVALAPNFNVVLPYYEGDDPAQVAQAFVSEHGLTTVPNITELMTRLIAWRVAEAEAV